MNPVKWLVRIVLLFFLSRLSISVDTVTPDHFIKDDGEVIVSSGKAFAMGFFSPGSSKNRYVGIWYHQVPEKTVVWMANRENPINDTSGILSIDSRGNLALFQRNQTLPVWATNISIRGTRNCIAQLLDSGNLVLLQNGAILWQSFDYPTNTWLPYMKLGLSLKTGLNRFLTSWKSPDDPRIGTYSIRIDPRGFPQMFLFKGSVPWWRTGSWTGRRWSGVPEMNTLIRNYIFNVSFVNNDDEVLIIDRLTNASILTRAIINETGIFERSTWNNQAQHWFGFFSAPKEQCDFYSHCGPNGYCDRSNDFECTCFPGFEPKSPQGWNLRDGTGGCVRKRGGSRCQNGEGFMKVARMKVPDTSETIADMSLGLKQCKEKCLKNCSCVAYASAYFESERKGGIGCLTWHGDLVDARAYPDSGQDLYIRVDADELARHTKKGVLQKKGLLAVLTVLAVIMFLVVVILLHWLVRRQRKARKRRQSKNVFGSSLLKESVAGKEIDEDRIIADLPFFDISTMATATNNFSSDNKLGQGGFGSVYKGVLFNGKEIAVKRLSKHSGQGVEEFKNEILLIAKLQHRNLVRILGCCIEGEEKMLIYEYLPNKSLDSFIFDESKRSLLGWKKRFEIIFGVARGILYLHQDSRLRIIHRDLKASNVLLDAAMNPKISDFGMARMFGGDEIEGKTKRVVGTYGYMSPEYAMEGHFSMKSDVYSFGVLMLEIVTGRKNSSCYPDSPSYNLVGHVWDLWKADKVLEVVDSTLGDSYPTDEFLKCTQIGLLCAQEHAADRPMMSTVVFMLGNETALPSPKQPAFIRKKVHQDKISGEGTCSANDVTVTMIQAR